MQPKLLIHNNFANTLILEDITDYISEYEYSMLVADTYKASECITIDVIFKNTTANSQVVYAQYHPKFTPNKVQLDFDGWGLIQHIIVPNKEWVCKQRNSEASLLMYYKTVYYSDGNFCYKINSDGEEEIVELTELVEVCNVGTTILKTSYDFVILGRLKRCYIEICKQLLDNGLNRCLSKDNDSELIYLRDAILMTINTVSYLVEFEEFAEAQRIIENVSNCNGLCQQVERPKRGGCGCRR